MRHLTDPRNLSAVDALMHQQVLWSVNNFLNLTNPTEAAKVLDELFREFIASTVWAENLTYDHKLVVTDVYLQMQQLLRQLGDCETA